MLEKLKNIAYPRVNTMAKVISNKITTFHQRDYPILIIRRFKNRLIKELEIKYQSSKTIMKKRTIDFNYQNMKNMLGLNSGQLTTLEIHP